MAGTAHGTATSCPEISSHFFILWFKSTTTESQLWQYVQLNGECGDCPAFKLNITAASTIWLHICLKQFFSHLIEMVLLNAKVRAILWGLGILYCEWKKVEYHLYPFSLSYILVSMQRSVSKQIGSHVKL